MDKDLEALKPFDNSINDLASWSTIMTLHGEGDGIPYGLIMSKAGLPITKIWMHHYNDVEEM